MGRDLDRFILVIFVITASLTVFVLGSLVLAMLASPL